MPTIIPPDYESPMGLAQTERAVKLIKDHFEHTLAAKLDLLRISAPLFVRADDGVQDNLNGVERAIGFAVKGVGDVKCEIVQSLAKWKRQALYRYGFEAPAGTAADKPARVSGFDALRKNYPIRREFRFSRVALTGASPTLLDTVRALGFDLI